MYEKLLTTSYRFSKPKISSGLHYKLSHNVYYVINVVKPTRYNRL